MIIETSDNRLYSVRETGTTSNYVFGGNLYQTEAGMLDAIAHDYITSGGRASLADVRDILLAHSDADLAADCITEWELDTPPDPADQERHSHMMTHYYQASDLERAVARFRADINHDLDVEARGDGEMHEPV